MKRAFFYFMMVLILALGFVACSDDGDDDNDNDTITGSDLIHIENTDFDYMMGIFASDIYNKSTHIIFIDSYDYNDPLESATLEINGETISLTETNYDGMYSSYWAEVSFNFGDQLSCEVGINGNNYNVSLTVPYHPSVSFPEIYDPSVSTDVSWSLSQDSEYQLFELYGNSSDYENEDGMYKELSSSSRQYTVPANWIDSTLDEYSMSVSEFFADWDGEKLIAIAADGETADYGEGWKQDKKRVQKKLKKLVEFVQK